jgi:GDP-D-mannose 3', 5'-epimerase
MKCLVLGGAGFIGSHLAKRLKQEGNYVRVVDIKENEYMEPDEYCNDFVKGDLRDPDFVHSFMSFNGTKGSVAGTFDEVYQLAADMGGAGYIFTGENDANVMHNSALINLNVVHEAVKQKAGRLFYSSSACMYPAYNQEDPNNPNCAESSAYPAAPDSEYGWEKLFSERLYKAFERNYGLQVRIARFHNIYGPLGTWNNGKEKAPAAICRKVAEAAAGSNVRNEANVVNSNAPAYVDIWGDGKQTRSFLYIDECVEGILRLMRSDCTEILNIGSDELISINDLAKMVIDISGKNLTINNITGPTGVRGRNSDNALIKEQLDWAPSEPLINGMHTLYEWVLHQVKKN